MAYVEKIWFFEPVDKTNKMAVFVKLSPAGDVRVNVDVPEDFYKCIMKLAQTAADLHEAQMRAQILADGAKP